MKPNTFYHIYNRGNNRENIFKELKNYTFFLEQFSNYLSEHVDVIAYCLMPNHFHFLIWVKEMECEEGKLSPVIKALRDFLIKYSKTINTKYGRVGSLFQQKFKRKEVDSDRYLLQLIQYIHRNPVAAGYVDDYTDWRYSSYNAILSEGKSGVHREMVLELFEGRDAFILSHQAYDEANRYL